MESNESPIKTDRISSIYVSMNKRTLKQSNYFIKNNFGLRKNVKLWFSKKYLKNLFHKEGS